MFKLKHDKAADAIYISLDSSKYAYGRDLDDRRRIDYNDSGQYIGIELLAVSKGVNLSDLPFIDSISVLLNKSDIKTYQIKPSYVY